MILKQTEKKSTKLYQANRYIHITSACSWISPLAALAVSSNDKEIDMIRLNNANISKSEFDDVNLSKTRFNNVNLSSSSFKNIDMSNAVFKDVCFVDAEIYDVNLSGMRINGVLVTDLLDIYKNYKS